MMTHVCVSSSVSPGQRHTDSYTIRQDGPAMASIALPTSISNNHHSKKEAEEKSDNTASHFI
jgi:hypothetical protein